MLVGTPGSAAPGSDRTVGGQTGGRGCSSRSRGSGATDPVCVGVGVTLQLALFLAVGFGSERVSARLPGGESVIWERGRTPMLLVLPKVGEGWIALAERVLRPGTDPGTLRTANIGRDKPLKGIAVQVPWTALRRELRVSVASALFPRDLRTSSGWEHEIVAPWGGDGESWWEVAEWFCGDGARYPSLREANPALPMFPPRGSRVLIPEVLLLADFRAVQPLRPSPVPTATVMPTPRPSRIEAVPTAVPVPSAPLMVPQQTRVPTVQATASREEPTKGAAPVAGVSSSPGALLEYREGEAIYRLRAGEALYSAVVVRFTGQVHGPEVNATAAELARRSGIADVTDIPIGYEVHIPFDLLLPEHLPADHPRRREWEKDREELAAIRRVIRAANLDGIHVVLDAGHGGADTGAIVHGVWETTYVYDVMARVKAVLERETKASVWTTVQSAPFGTPPPPSDLLPQSRAQRLLVDPPYNLADSSSGVHLRWILANAILDRLAAQKVEAERVAFVSIHADSLHPAVRGLMVYVPGRSRRPPSVAVPGGLPSCREVRQQKEFRMPSRFRARSEALSTQLGEAIVRATQASGLPVHPYEPVRSSVLRRRARWVPAVLRYNRVPTAVLIEICNLNSDDDRALLLTEKYREKLAHAIAAGLAEAFSR